MFAASPSPSPPAPHHRQHAFPQPLRFLHDATHPATIWLLWDATRVRRAAPRHDEGLVGVLHHAVSIGGDADSAITADSLWTCQHEVGLGPGNGTLGMGFVVGGVGENGNEDSEGASQFVVFIGDEGFYKVSLKFVAPSHFVVQGFYGPGDARAPKAGGVPVTSSCHYLESATGIAEGCIPRDFKILAVSLFVHHARCRSCSALLHACSCGSVRAFSAGLKGFRDLASRCQNGVGAWRETRLLDAVVHGSKPGASDGAGETDRSADVGSSFPLWINDMYDGLGNCARTVRLRQRFFGEGLESRACGSGCLESDTIGDGAGGGIDIFGESSGIIDGHEGSGVMEDGVLRGGVMDSEMLEECQSWTEKDGRLTGSSVADKSAASTAPSLTHAVEEDASGPPQEDGSGGSRSPEGSRSLEGSANGSHNLGEEKQTTFPCPNCPKSFTQQRARRRHLGTVHAPRRHTCNRCGAKFQQASHLRTHTVLVHLKTNDYVCEVCGDRFPIRSRLTAHRKNVHPGVQPPS